MFQTDKHTLGTLVFEGTTKDYKVPHVPKSVFIGYTIPKLEVFNSLSTCVS